MPKLKNNKNFKGFDNNRAVGKTTGTGKPTRMRARYKSFCSKCHYTIWQNEEIFFNGASWHTDCLSALQDPTPRYLDKRYIEVMGKVKKEKLVKLINTSPSGR